MITAKEARKLATREVNPKLDEIEKLIKANAKKRRLVVEEQLDELVITALRLAGFTVTPEFTTRNEAKTIITW